MAGGAQGGGARPAQANPQGAQQYQGMLQNYRQGMAGMPSQVPGANLAAPGGSMVNMPLMGGLQGGPTNQIPQQFNPFANSPPPQLIQSGNPQAPQMPPQAFGNPQAPQMPPQAFGNPQAPQAPQMPPEQQQRMEALGAQIRTQQGMSQQAQGQVPPEVLQRYLAMSRGLGDRPQVLGNPNATPLQRPQR